MPLVLLRRRLLLLFVGVVLGVVILGVLARAVVRARDEAAVHGRTIRVAREEVGRLRAAYSEQEDGERGFAISADDSFLRPYTKASNDAAELLKSLQSAATSVPELRAPLQEVAAAASRWRTEAAEPEIALARSGDRQGALQSIDSGTGAALFATVQRNLDALDRQVAQATTRSDDRAATTRRELTLLVVLVLVVLATGTLLAAWLIRRWVTRPIDRLVADVRRVRSGEPDASIHATGPPEIAELATDIDEMRRRIEHERVEAERAREAVEQNAAVVLALRSQLEPDIGSLPEGWTVAARLRAAEGVVAGDCYDLAHLASGALGLIVVDIAGHGATEGILALRYKELVRASLAAEVAPGDAIDAAASQLGSMGSEVFLTAFVAIIDTQDGQVTYANAGHPPAFICTADGAADLEPTGPLVGLIGSGWDTQTAWIAPGDNLCAYTDGLVEVRNDAREFFGPERLRALVSGARCEAAASIVKRCLDEAEAFAAGRMHDDATIVVLCRPDGTSPASEV